MKKYLSVSILFSSLVLASITPVFSREEKPVEVKADADYYAGINTSKKGDELKQELYNLINPHTKRDYDTLEVDMRTTDRDWTKSPNPDDENPIMVILYADYNDTKNITWDKSQGKFGTSENGKYVWNKEHIWAKSNGFASEGLAAYSDLHHLRASDHQLNSVRSNNAFSNVSGNNYANDHFGDKSGCKSSGTFEPQDQYKGDVARALFYMATCYCVSGHGSNSALTLTTGTDASGGKFGYLDTLLAWHELDPVDNFEANRNELVYGLQGNRNPYIDHPEYAKAVFKNQPIEEVGTLQSIAISGTASKTKYKEGERFSSIGLTVTATLKKSDNSTFTKDVTSQVTWSPDPLVKNTTQVTATYTLNGVTKTATLNGIQVVELSDLTVTGTPDKLEYTEGESFDPTGLTIKAIYSDNSEEDVTSSVTWLPSRLELGATQVMGVYGSLNVVVSNIVVNKNLLTSYKIQFSDTTGETEITNSSNIQFASGSDYVSSISDLSKIYTGKTGKSGLRIGTGSSSGSMTINLASKGQVSVSKIKVGIQKYNSSDTTPTLEVSLDNDDFKKAEAVSDTAVTEVELTFDGEVATKIYLKTSGGKSRLFLSYLEICSGSSGGDDEEVIPVSNVSVDKGTASIEVGQSFTITATISPENATNKTVIWTSNNIAVATVSQAGVVTGVKAGIALIKASSSNGLSATCIVTVTGSTQPDDPTPTDPEDPSEPSNPSKPASSNGCGGNIVTVSITLSVISLIGISLLLIRRKEQ